MKKILFLSCFFFIADWAYGQQGFPNYYRYADLARRADSLYQQKDYSAAAENYAQAITIKVEKGIELSYSGLNFNAAIYWAAAGKIDSAFARLGTAIDLGFSDLRSAETNSDFEPIKNDARWKRTLERIGANQLAKNLANEAFLRRTTFTGNTEQIIFNPPKDNIHYYLFNKNFPFISVNSGNFRIYFRANSHAGKNLEELKTAIADAQKRSFEVLGVTAHQRGINLVMVDDRDEMKELTGLSVGGGLVIAESDIVFLVWNGTRRMQARHEIFHVFSHQIWGITQSRLLNEGSAVYTDNTCHFKNPIYTVNAQLQAAGKHVPIGQLIENFDNVARTQEVVAYLQSAAIFKYLYETYGQQRIKRLWKEGFGEFRKIYGFDLDRLEKELTRKLTSIHPKKNMDIKMLLEEGCG